MENMILHGPAPTKETYNLLLKHHQSKGNLQALVSTLEDMSAKGVSPDIASFTIVLDGLLQSGRSEPTRTLFRLMASFKVEPNTAMVTAIMHHLLLKGDQESLKSASDLLLQMEVETNVNRRPNSITYTQLMDAFYSCAHITATEAETAVEELWQRMLRFRVKPTRVTFEVLAKAAFRNNNASLAMNYFHQQRDRQIPFTNSLFEIMLRNLLMLRELELARDVINEINASRKELPSSLKMYIDRVKNFQVSRKSRGRNWL
jgi:pentatricopeptide repeat domain-containing protein 1